MKIFFGLTIFAALAIAGLGFYLIVKTAQAWPQPCFAVAQIVVGSILALTGITLLLALLIVTVSEKANKRNVKNKGGKQ